MPTGYTAGIIDGDIKTFKEYATLCMRAFGGTIHMRDESLDTEYKPRIASDYHKTNYEELEIKLNNFKKITPSEYVNEYKTNINNSIKSYKGFIDNAKENEKRLKNMLVSALKYTPPTNEHIGIRDFMVNQLQETIKFDGNYEYYEEKIEELQKDLLNIDAEKIYQEEIDDILKSIDYHKVEYEKELKRVEESNKWVTDFLNSLEK
jgi:hypothetical protein